MLTYRAIATNYLDRDGNEYPAYPDGSSIKVYDDMGNCLFDRDFSTHFNNKDDVLTELTGEHFFDYLYENQEDIEITFGE